ncbi:MAG TPA: DUF1007 family protein [Reyranella sp.]|jgi:hypothetical protein|nr:DUF1007 family protein [Reyranella sp.]
MKWFLAALALVLAAAPAFAHPHIWISQRVRAIAANGQYTHVEIEWRFDPMASETEIPPIDEDGDGKISADEVKVLAAEMMPDFEKNGFLTWLNTGGKDFRPPKAPSLEVHIDDPATFTPADWNHDQGHEDAGMPMPKNKQVEQPPPHPPRNLVYVMRFELPQPTRSVSVTTYEPEDMIRIEVDKAGLPKDCTLSKHPAYKSEFVKGRPFHADMVTCRLP